MHMDIHMYTRTRVVAPRAGRPRMRLALQIDVDVARVPRVEVRGPVHGRCIVGRRAQLVAVTAAVLRVAAEHLRGHTTSRGIYKHESCVNMSRRGGGRPAVAWHSSHAASCQKGVGRPGGGAGVRKFGCGMARVGVATDLGHAGAKDEAALLARMSKEIVSRVASRVRVVRTLAREDERRRHVGSAVNSAADDR